MSVGSIFVDKLWAGFLMIFVPDVELRVHDNVCYTHAELLGRRLVAHKVVSEDVELVFYY